MLEAQASYHLKCIGFACKAARIQHAKQTLMQLNRVVERMAGSKGALRFSHQWWKYKVKFEEASLLWYQNVSTCCTVRRKSMKSVFEIYISSCIC